MPTYTDVLRGSRLNIPKPVCIAGQQGLLEAIRTVQAAMIQTIRHVCLSSEKAGGSSEAWCAVLVQRSW